MKTNTKYQQLAGLNDGSFRRLTGVKRSTFKLMIEILTQADSAKQAVGGRKSKLCIEDRLLLALEYLREYRTYFHITKSSGLSESNGYKICRFVEDTLLRTNTFPCQAEKLYLNRTMTSKWF